MMNFSDPALDAVERITLKKRRALGAARIFSAVVSLALSLAILATVGQTLEYYNKSKLAANWSLPIWPTGHLEVAPSVALLAVSGITAALSLGFIVFGVLGISKPSKKLNLIAGATGTTSLAVTMVGLAFFFARNNIYSSADNIMSWSCKYSALPAGSVPEGMGRTCTNSKFSAYATIPLVIFEGIFLLLTAADLSMERRISKTRRELDIKSIDGGSRNSQS